MALAAFWCSPHLAASQPSSAARGCELEAGGDAVSSQEAPTAHSSQTTAKAGAVLRPLNLLQALPVLPFPSSRNTGAHPAAAKHESSCLIIHGLCPQVLLARPAEYLPE